MEYKLNGGDYHYFEKENLIKTDYKSFLKPKSPHFILAEEGVFIAVHGCF